MNKFASPTAFLYLVLLLFIHNNSLYLCSWTECRIVEFEQVKEKPVSRCGSSCSSSSSCGKSSRQVETVKKTRVIVLPHGKKALKCLGCCSSLALLETNEAIAVQRDDGVSHQNLQKAYTLDSNNYAYRSIKANTNSPPQLSQFIDTVILRL